MHYRHALTSSSLLAFIKFAYCCRSTDSVPGVSFVSTSSSTGLVVRISPVKAFLYLQRPHFELHHRDEQY